jgi:hypothetical protein
VVFGSSISSGNTDVPSYEFPRQNSINPLHLGIPETCFTRQGHCSPPESAIQLLILRIQGV